MVRPSAESFEGLILPYMGFGRKVLFSFEPTSGDGIFSRMSNSSLISPFRWEKAQHDWNIVDKTAKPQLKQTKPA